MFQRRAVQREKLHIILSIDPASVRPEETSPARTRTTRSRGAATEGKGKVFYTSFGHDPKVWKDEKFQKHLFGGLKWATGELGRRGQAEPRSVVDTITRQVRRPGRIARCAISALSRFVWRGGEDSLTPGRMLLSAPVNGSPPPPSMMATQAHTFPCPSAAAGWASEPRCLGGTSAARTASRSFSHQRLSPGPSSPRLSRPRRSATRPHAALFTLPRRAGRKHSAPTGPDVRAARRDHVREEARSPRTAS